MVLKHSQIIKAFKATERLADNENLPVKTIWDLYNLRRVLQPHYAFRMERENLMRKKYIPMACADGSLVGEPLKQFKNEINELNDMEVDIGDFVKFTIDIQRCKGITVRDIEILEPFIQFSSDIVCETGE